MNKILLLIVILVFAVLGIWLISGKINSKDEKVLGTEVTNNTQSSTTSMEILYTETAISSYENSIFEKTSVKEISADTISNMDGIDKDCYLGYQEYVYRQFPVIDNSKCGKIFSESEIC